jgi:oligopeptide transport system permease protein
MRQGAEMVRFIAKRIVGLALTLFLIATLSFAVMRLAPGGPFDREKATSPVIRRHLEAKYRLDRPALLDVVALRRGDVVRAIAGTQYASYLKDLLRGDLGPSFKYRNRTVNEILAESFPVSLLLGCFALYLALLVGIGAGIFAARRHGTVYDRAAMAGAMVGVALPNFLIGAFLLILFGFSLRWFPVAGWGSPWHLVLPGIALGAPYAAYIARLVRTSMLETLSRDFIRTARAKGLPERQVVFKHALRVALLPVVSYLGPAFAGIITGSLVIESIFAIPGVGSHFVNAALNRDYTMIMGTVLLYSILLVTFNAVVDVLYSYLDPRIELR